MPVPPPDKETYLGDGVYASFDGFQIWLRTVRSDGIQHRIALDDATFVALKTFAEEIRKASRQAEPEQQPG